MLKHCDERPEFPDEATWEWWRASIYSTSN